MAQTKPQAKKQSSVLTVLAGIFKSSTARCVFVLLLLVLASLGMVMLDKLNFVRKTYLVFLEDNAVLSFMNFFGIERMNILRGAWILFLCVAAYVLFVLASNVIENNVLKTSKNKKLVVFVYGLILVVVFALLALVAYKLGAFEKIDKTAEIFLNLLYTLFICLLFVAIILIIPIAVYYVIKFLVFCFVVLVVHLAKFAKQVQLHRSNVSSEDGDANEEVIPCEKVFPALVKIDDLGVQPSTVNTEIELEQLALQFQSFASNVHKIYYELPLIRSFIAALGTSRLIILEGLSGTGKSMLPRLFSEFTGSKAFFAPVQATWRDKTDVLGFYSEFAKTFKTTQFLENLYKASYTDKANLMVLDEMNLSRIEYYFADFLSVMEYPPEDWKIRIYEIQAGQKLPNKLENGCVSVPTNTWFVGTANTDDSTFTITDKVYDRAVVIDFEEKATPIVTDYNSDKISISAESLSSLFEKAESQVENCLSDKETEKFFKICDFMKESFNVSFGNRIMAQIESFVPIYVALGGTKEQALDFMFARKILRKVDGMFEDFVKEELINLNKLISSLYGKGVFKETEKLISKFIKRLV